ncbi:MULTISPECIES: alpha/beta fold hydrolase [Sphingobacterium]|uniref:alpha/beta fold hydrolase n=1 Tax=Sphingobacterium TaxID=28453 RepID=UPI00240D7D92|nr:alpha/beta hydrolase [Sphingobacterium sp. WM]WFB65168.1 alpha/beta hydrolase [Sphingobacterium sp. WM]
MTDKIVQNLDISLFTQSFGNKRNPPVLLIAGATVSMLFWDTEFCQKLADKGLFVIRFDFRDTGKSTSVPEGTANYNMLDFADDLISILDSYEISAAHLVGISLGGMIAQILAIRNSDRVKSLTLLSTMPWGDSEFPIPEMDTRILDFHAKGSDINWDNEDKVVHYMLQGSQLMSGKKPLNVLREENYLRESYRRANNFRSQFNHASISGGMEYYNQLDKIKAPVLVIHGTEDIICHFQNAIAIMQKLRGQNLVVLEGTGHELHEEDWDLIINSIVSMVKMLEQ